MELWGFKFRGVSVIAKFHRPLAAKLCIRCEDILEEQEWYGPPLSPHYASAVYVFVMCPSVCLYVCHMTVLYQNG